VFFEQLRVIVEIVLHHKVVRCERSIRREPLRGRMTFHWIFQFHSEAQQRSFVLSGRRAFPAWDKKGVALHLLDVGGQTIDTSSTMGRFFLTVMAGAAEMERGMARDRTVAVMAHKRSKNERISRHIPFGWELAENGVDLVADEAEQEAIERIRELRADGLSLRKIARELDERGIPTKSGRKWNHNTVAAILKRAA